MPYVLALDQGTTSSRALVFNRRGRAVATAQQEFTQHYPRPGWVEHDPRDLWTTVRRTALAAVAEANLTGKDLAAREIHQISPRKESPFVSFNCGGFTNELINSELFGYEKGAFTGATATRIGLLESASGGTDFLDEIGEMPLSMQVKILHVIQ